MDVLERLPVPTYSGLTTSALKHSLAIAKIRIVASFETGKTPSDEHLADFWYLNVEASRRGIPPILRKLPRIRYNDKPAYVEDDCEIEEDEETELDEPELVAALIAVDLQWLVSRYPSHQAKHPRWRELWNPSAFHGKARFLALQRRPKLKPWDYHKGLALTDEQKIELHTIRLERERFRVADLLDELEQIRFTLEYHYGRRDSRYQSDDPVATIDERLNIWFIGSIFGWRPQRLANLMCAFTGKPMTRQWAAKRIAQVHRDLPESKPKKRGRKNNGDSLNNSLPVCPSLSEG